MKHSSLSHLILGLFVLIMVSNIFANTISAGGVVPEQRNISIAPTFSDEVIEPYKLAEIATLQIDNNLPDYELVLEFSDRYGSVDLIEEVYLIGMFGTLGEGLEIPANAKLTQAGNAGRFIWSPGSQKSATLAYQLKVMVIYKRALSSPPLLTVSMPSAL